MRGQGGNRRHFSVSLAAASHDGAKEDTARRLAAEFPRRLGWHPDMVLSFAGGLAYTRYRTLMRFVMKQIARGTRFPTDTNRDHEFTNWEDVARLASDIEQMITGRAAAPTLVAAENHGWCARTANGDNPVQRCFGWRGGCTCPS